MFPLHPLWLKVLPNCVSGLSVSTLLHFLAQLVFFFFYSVPRPSNKEGVQSPRTGVMMRERERERGVDFPFLVGVVCEGPLLRLTRDPEWTQTGSDGWRIPPRRMTPSHTHSLPPSWEILTGVFLDADESSPQLVIIKLMDTASEERHWTLLLPHDGCMRIHYIAFIQFTTWRVSHVTSWPLIILTSDWLTGVIWV